MCEKMKFTILTRMVWAAGNDRASGRNQARTQGSPDGAVGCTTGQARTVCAQLSCKVNGWHGTELAHNIYVLSYSTRCDLRMHITSSAQLAH